ncbi:MAG: hypothetical protein B7X58_06995, partial [Marinobacter sp. 34-60-7]
MAESAKAKRTDSKELTDKQQRFRRFVSQGAREGMVLALIVLCIYLAMALFTFTPSDPGWASIGHDMRVQNDAGRTGAWLASLLMDFFGHVSWLFPAMVAGYAVMLIRRRNQPLDMHWPLFMVRFGGFLLILLSATSLLSLYSVFGLGESSGGVLGTAVSEAMVRFFNLPATTLLLIAILLFALTVTTGLSWFWLMDQVGGLALKTGQSVKALVSSDGKAKARPEPEARREPVTKPADPRLPPQSRPEPPVVSDRVKAADAKAEKPAILPWWKRLFGRKKAASPIDSAAAGKRNRNTSGRDRREPGIDGLAEVDPEPARLESFSSHDNARDNGNAADQRTREPFPAHRRVAGRPGAEEQDAAAHGPARRHRGRRAWPGRNQQVSRTLFGCRARQDRRACAHHSLYPETAVRSVCLEGPECRVMIERRLFSPLGWTLFTIIVVLGLTMPLLHVFVPEGSTFHVSAYTLTLVGKILCYAAVALAMDMVWGYAGILSLGHGLFFALGGYAFGMYLMRQIGRDGQYQSDLPDFMVFLDW